MKPWVKGTSEGRLYVDTKHPEWKKWFIEQIEKYSKLNILKKAPSMSGEQKTEYVTCIQTENSALKEAIIELIPMAEQARDNLPVNAHPAVAMLMNKRIERAKKLLNKQPQSESDGDKNLS